jgi:putative addiction module CopG family antidote
MNVSLTPELEAEVKALIKSGRYGNQSEVVRAGLRMVLEQEEIRKMRVAAFRKELEEIYADAMAGNTVDLDVDRIMDMVRERNGIAAVERDAS